MEVKQKASSTSHKSSTATCGLVMPIGPLDGCTVEHWAEVKAIVTEAIESVLDPRFTVRLVSDADDIGIIQKRIVQNVYTSDIIVCDVSGKNPNVMFELGMRLAFDKPVVIVKDDKTDYSFDTGIIEHVGYPRDLRFAKIVEFKKTLAAKVTATHNTTTKNPEHSPFLKSFGKFQVANLEETTVSSDKLVLELVEELRHDVRRIQRKLESPDSRADRRVTPDFFGRLAAIIPKAVEADQLTDARALIGSEKFYDLAEKACDAPRYFNSREEFVSAVDSFLKIANSP